MADFRHNQEATHGLALGKLTKELRNEVVPTRITLTMFVTLVGQYDSFKDGTIDLAYYLSEKCYICHRERGLSLQPQRYTL